MRSQVVIRWARKPWLAALLLVALGSRILVPGGFMPGSGGLVLCTGHGPMILTTARDVSGAGMSLPAGIPGQGGQGPDHESMGICPFAAAASPLAAPHAVVVVVVAYLIPGSVELPSQQFTPRGTIVPSRLPRGPPTSYA